MSFTCTKIAIQIMWVGVIPGVVILQSEQCGYATTTTTKITTKNRSEATRTFQNQPIIYSKTKAQTEAKMQSISNNNYLLSVASFTKEVNPRLAKRPEISSRWPEILYRLINMYPLKILTCPPGWRCPRCLPKISIFLLKNRDRP